MRAKIEIRTENCKGCGLCIKACPAAQLSYSGELNSHGYNYVQASNDDCRGCGFCFYTCPEPYAIQVFKEIKKAAGEN